MYEEIRRIAVHGSVATHTATREVDAPALAHGVARPDERDRASVGGRGAKMSNFGLAEHRAGKILKADAIENILSRRQIVEQRFGSEVRFRQRVDEHGASNVPERVGGWHLDPHPRRPIGTGPHHAGVRRYVAGLYAVRNLRPARGEAQGWVRDATDRGAGRRHDSALHYRAPRQCRAVSHRDGHWAFAIKTQ